MGLQLPFTIFEWRFSGSIGWAGDNNESPTIDFMVKGFIHKKICRTLQLFPLWKKEMAGFASSLDHRYSKCRKINYFFTLSKTIILPLSPIGIINLLDFFTAWTNQSSVKSYLWSHIWNITEYGGYLRVSYTHHMVHFCLLPAISDGIQLCNHYWHQPITFLHSVDTSKIYS
jgi:hypothetical protein